MTIITPLQRTNATGIKIRDGINFRYKKTDRGKLDTYRQTRFFPNNVRTSNENSIISSICIHHPQISLLHRINNLLYFTSGVYIKFEIHIFAPHPPSIRESYYFPKGNILQLVGARRRGKFSSLFFVIL